jgi:hypothetical protein
MLNFSVDKTLSVLDVSIHRTTGTVACCWYRYKYMLFTACNDIALRAVFLSKGTMNIGKYEDCAHYVQKEKNAKNKKALLRKIWFRQKILRKFEMPYLEIFITTKCNLRCEYCSNLIPDCKTPEHIDKETIFKTLDKLLSNIDRLYRLKLHGGEVFLHPQLFDIIEYAGKQQKILSFRLATNGTIIPNEKILDLIKEFNFVVQISDYNLPNVKTNELIRILEEKNVRYVYLNNRMWRDMGGFEERENNRRRDCTISRCISLFDGKIHICSHAAMMDKLHILNSDCVSVFQDRKPFQKDMIRFYNNLSVNACLHCNGDTKFALEIPAGIQRGSEQCE